MNWELTNNHENIWQCHPSPDSGQVSERSEDSRFTMGQDSSSLRSSE